MLTVLIEKGSINGICYSLDDCYMRIKSAYQEFLSKVKATLVKLGDLGREAALLRFRSTQIFYHISLSQLLNC